MVKIDFNSRRESSPYPADEGEYDQIPVREHNGLNRCRFGSVELEKRTSYGRNHPPTLLKEYEARRWYETKAAKDLIQTISFYSDDDYDDNEWGQSCPPESDSVEKQQHPRYYDEEIDVNLEDISEQRKWQKFRDLIDYCYPALSRKKEYYKCPFPCCPSHDPGSKLMLPTMAEDGDENQPAVTSPSSADPIGPVSTPPAEGSKAKPEKYTELDDEFRAAGRGLDVFDPTLDLDDPAEGVDESKQQVLVKSCCEDEDFWTTLLQILILAPLLAFTAYLFVQWYKTRREYIKELGKLNKLRRENENLVGDINRLCAFVMSCQMSPIVSVKRQCKLEDKIRRICQSLKNHEEKIEELEQERGIYREVLWNLKTCA